MHVRQRGDAGLGLRRTCKPVSTCLNAFLNAGEGGTAHLGVLDDAQVAGFMMSYDEIEHCLCQIDDTFAR